MRVPAPRWSGGWTLTKEAGMALFDRNDERGYGDRGGFADRAQNAARRGWNRAENAFSGDDADRGFDGDEHLRRDYENRSTMDTGGPVHGWNAKPGGYGPRPLDREGNLHQRNSWSDGAWTADAAERADREWNQPNRDRGYDRDVRPSQAGWRAGGISGGGMGMQGGMGMNRGMDDGRGWPAERGGMQDRGWSAGGTRDWSDRDRSDRGMDRGGFVDRAQNAARRGWERVEHALDRDDTRDGMHLGGGAMRGGTAWAGRYDRDTHAPSNLRGYRDENGNYGVRRVGGMQGGMRGAGTGRYGTDYDRGRMAAERGTGYGRDYRASRYDRGYGHPRDWF